MINQLSANPPNNPVGTSGLLTKLLPLISDTSTAVRANLLKLFRVLPPAEVGPHVEKILMYIRGGMTHLSTDIRNDTLNMMEWLLEVAGDEVVSCPGGWLKSLNSFSSMLGWNPTVNAVTVSKGWTSASKATLGATTKKGPEAQARQILVLARFLQVGFQEESPTPYDPRAYWDNLYRLPATANPFAYLNLFGTPRDEDSEMYPDRLSRQRVFEAKWKGAILEGMEGARKEGGAVGRSASSLAKVLSGEVKVKPSEPELCTHQTSTVSFASDLPKDANNDAFDTKELKEALPPPPPVNQIEPEALGDWEKPTKYDYTAEDPDKWESGAQVYEYVAKDDEDGEIGPEHPELELELFGDPARRNHQGIDFTRIAAIELYQEGPARVEPISKFEDAGLHPAMLRNVQLSGYVAPTPIQRYCLPAIGAGYDVIAIAQTGSGKTAAYLIPILNKLMGKAKKLAAPRPDPTTPYRPGLDRPYRAEPLVVIVCPSRELAIQIFNEARKFCYRTMLRPCVIYGGGPIREQIVQLQKGCDVLVASPGRLIDFIERPDILSLRRLRYMVIDEADEMLHDDWQAEFTAILEGGEQEEGNVKYMLFSATFPKAARDLAKTHLAETHVRLRVGRAGSTHENIKQNIIMVDPPMKKKALFDLVNSLPPTRTIIFVNSKRAADELDDFLYNQGIPCASMHSDRTQKEREATMRAFRAGKCPVLIATAVSARGIDVKNVMHVINYDLPTIDYGGIEEYTHRIGRTGRIGFRGLATSFYTERDEPLASVLTRTLMETNQEIPDFLERFKPQSGRLTFEADSDFDENDIVALENGGEADQNGFDTNGGGFEETAASSKMEGGGW
ncbi:P-loop containing nucleoside triphosphate hydrolase protein [Rhypophila sp. PSN 637]